MLGTENGFRVLGYGGSTNPITDNTTVKDFWTNSSGPTKYGMIVGGSTDFFIDTNYVDAAGKLSIRGNNGGDALNYFGGNGIVVKEGYTYEITVKFVPLSLNHKNKPVKVAIALVQDSETAGARPIGTKFPPHGNIGIYYADRTLRGASEWPTDVPNNVYRYSKDLIGKYVGDEEESGYPVYENGIYLPEDPEIEWFEYCEQTLTATYKYGETDLGYKTGEVNTMDLGAHFGIMVGGQGATVDGSGTHYFSQICVSDVTIKVTAPAELAEFEDGAVFHNGGNGGNGGNNPGPGPVPTGDSSNIVLWTTLLLASGVGIICTSVYSRKRRYNR